ncbi:hypothetical protein ACSNO4_05005 [Kocuria flava]|uniref:hypothetical protein n=1 Tax=Kocuria flava TaxID=446860 RepID=UPI003F1AA5E1
MPVEMGIWRVDTSGPRRLSGMRLPSEEDLERFLEEDPSILGDPLLIIGRQVRTDFGTYIDLLAMDQDANLHVLELKRDRTPREVIAQVLDYGSWTAELDRNSILDIANSYLNNKAFEAAFEETFGSPPPDELNDEQNLTVVAAELDTASERIVTYLNRQFGVPVNVVFFRYFEDEDRRYLARSWLISAEEATPSSAGGSKSTKRAAWNGTDWYVNFGEDKKTRAWEDARQYNFVSAGGAPWFWRTLHTLPVGARIFVRIPQTGYVGVGTTTGPARRFEEALVTAGGQQLRLADQPLQGTYRHADEVTDDNAEYVVPVEWIKTLPAAQAINEKGLFGNQNSACKLRQQFTLDRLYDAFGLAAD